MNEPTSPDWPADRPPGLVQGHVSCGLRAESGCGIGTLRSIERAGRIATVQRADGTIFRLLVARPGLLVRTLARPDLTRHEGRPLVVVNPATGVLGMGFGPPSLPERIPVARVSSLDADGEAVEVMAVDDGPAWILLAVIDTKSLRTKKPVAPAS